MLKKKDKRPRGTRKRDKVKRILAEVLIATAAWKAKGSVAHAKPQRNIQQIERLNNCTNTPNQKAFIGNLILNRETEVTKVVDKQGKIIKEIKTKTNRFSRAIRNLEQSRKKLIENIDNSIQKRLELFSNKLKIQQPKTYRQKIQLSWNKYKIKVGKYFNNYKASLTQAFLDMKNWFSNSFFYFKNSVVKETKLFFKNTAQAIKLIGVGIWKTSYLAFKILKVGGRTIKTLTSGGYIVIKIGLKTIIVPIVFTWDTGGLLAETFSITMSQLFN